MRLNTHTNINQTFMQYFCVLYWNPNSEHWNEPINFHCELIAIYSVLLSELQLYPSKKSECKSISSNWNLKHLIEDQFEHWNTNSFKLSVCLFYLGKLWMELRVQFNAIQSSTSKFSPFCNIHARLLTAMWMRLTHNIFLRGPYKSALVATPGGYCDATC